MEQFLSTSTTSWPNNATCDNSNEFTLREVITLPCVYVISSVFICVGNGFVVDCYRREKSARTVANVYILQLAIADLWVGLTLPIIGAIHILRKLKLLVHIDIICILNYSTFIFPEGASVFGLVMMTLDRFIAILHPLKYKVIMTKSRARNMCLVFVWLPSFALGLLLPTFWSLKATVNAHLSDPLEDNDCVKYLQCDLIKNINSNFFKYLFSPLFFLAAGIILLCYIPIIRVVKIHLNNSKLRGSVSSSELDKNSINRKEVRMMTTALLVLGTFLICWFPLQCALVAEVYFSYDLSNSRGFLYIPAIICSGMNPIIYAFRIPVFKTWILNKLCLSSKDVNSYKGTVISTRNAYSRTSVADESQKSIISPKLLRNIASVNQPRKAPQTFDNIVDKDAQFARDRGGYASSLNQSTLEITHI